VEDLESRFGADLSGLEFSVEQVPPREAGSEFGPDVVMDRGVPLGRLYREGLPGAPEPVIVLYRRPVEARARDQADRGEVVFAVVAELAAEYLGRDLG
jgi:hypothetical protein